MDKRTPIHEIGVLLVHGIGEHSRGHTLVNYGEPLARWIQDWIDGWSHTIDKQDLELWIGHLKRLKPLPFPSSASALVDDPERDIFQASSGPYSGRYTPEISRTLDRLFKRLRPDTSIGELPSDVQFFSKQNPGYIGGCARVTKYFDNEYSDNFSIDINIVTIDGEIEKISWLIKELYWSDCFPIADLARIALWSIKIAPWVIANYAAKRINRYFIMLLRKSNTATLAGAIFYICTQIMDFFHLIANVILIPIWMMLTFVTQAMLAIIYMSSFIPLDVVQKYSEAALRWFAAAIGDCYSFTSSSVREALIVNQVRGDMEWLSKECENLVIIAHSQGAAIVYTTLKGDIPDNLRLLVTLGSGIRKLLALQRLNLPGLNNLNIAITAGVIFEIIPLYALLLYFFPDIYYHSIYVTGQFSTFFLVKTWSALVVLLIIAASVWLSFSVDDYQKDIANWANSLRKRGVGWLDCFATKDPVSDGPTLNPEGVSSREETEPAVWKACEVHNSGGILFDHTSYAANRDECLSLIVTGITRQINSKVPLHLLELPGSDLISKSSALRRIRVRQLTLLPTIAVLLTFFSVWMRGDKLAFFGISIEGYFRSMKIGSSALRAIEQVPYQLAIVGGVGQFIVIVSCLIVPFIFWKAWEWREVKAFFNRQYSIYSIDIPNGDWAKFLYYFTIFFYAYTLNVVIVCIIRFALDLSVLNCIAFEELIAAPGTFILVSVIYYSRMLI